MTLFLIFLILFSHFVADFVMQSDEIALKKSTSLRALWTHGVDYLIGTGLIFLLMNAGGFIVMPVTTMVFLLCMNAAWHIVVDGLTSKLTTYYWKKEQRHWFFVTIGADQFIHLLIFFELFI